MNSNNFGKIQDLMYKISGYFFGGSLGGAPGGAVEVAVVDGFAHVDW